MPKNNFITELKATLIISFFIILSYFLALLIDLPKIDSLLLIIISSYVALFIILTFLNIYFKNKFINKATNIISLPLSILGVIGSVIMPFWLILMHIMFYFGIAFLIPTVILGAISYFGNLKLNELTENYLLITSSVFICVLFNPILLRIASMIPAISNKQSNGSTNLNLEPSKYVLSVRNVKFLVYAGYVIAILIINIFNFQGLSLTAGQNKDQTIIASFETFIAFDGSVGLLKLLDFRPSNLLNKIREAIMKEFSEIEEPEKSKEPQDEIKK